MSGTAAVYIRRAARVLLVDPADRLLMFRYVPDDLPAFWLLPGGECEPGEHFAAAARRELFEETGIAARPRHIAVTRTFDYVYQGQPVRGIEHFFHHRTSKTRIDTSGHTELEQRANAGLSLVHRGRATAMARTALPGRCWRPHRPGLPV